MGSLILWRKHELKIVLKHFNFCVTLLLVFFLKDTLFRVFSRTSLGKKRTEKLLKKTTPFTQSIDRRRTRQTKLRECINFVKKRKRRRKLIYIPSHTMSQTKDESRQAFPWFPSLHHIHPHMLNKYWTASSIGLKVDALERAQMFLRICRIQYYVKLF